MIEQPRLQKTGNAILLVDDNEFNLITLKEIIRQKFKVECDLAQNGQVAIDMVKNRLGNQYKLILMDLLMPLKNGYEASLEIREILKDDQKAS